MHEKDLKFLGKRVVIILGPTASGKSRLTLEMAQSTDGHIINADSQQLFRDLPILTAQPTPAERAVCPHSLYGILESQTRLNAWGWAEQVMQIIRQNARTPIFLVGGTGFYITALLKGLSPIPPVSEDIVRDIEDWIVHNGITALHNRLLQQDKETAQRLNPKDHQRLVRALSVLEATGMPLSAWHKKPRILLTQGCTFLCVALLPKNREQLYHRINQRFQEMVSQGALEEVQQLRELKGYKNFPAYQAIGVKSLDTYLDGLTSLEVAINQSQLETRHYAKRQITWLRHQTSPQMVIDPWEESLETVKQDVITWILHSGI